MKGFKRNNHLKWLLHVVYVSVANVRLRFFFEICLSFSKSCDSASLIFITAHLCFVSLSDYPIIFFFYA